MSAYLIAAIDIEDQAVYDDYIRLSGLAIASSTAIPLVVTDDPTLIEGKLPGRRIVVVEFENQQQLHDWYKATPYQEAVQHRFAGARTEFLIAVDGLN